MNRFNNFAFVAFVIIGCGLGTGMMVMVWVLAVKMITGDL